MSAIVLGRESVPWHVPRTPPQGADVWGRRALTVTIAAWSAGVFIGFENALRVVTILSFAAAVWGCRQPAAGLLGVTLLCTLDAVTRPLLMTGGLLRWNTLNYWFVLMVLTYVGFVRRTTGAQAVSAKVFVGLLIVHLLQSPDRSLGIQHLLGILSFFGLLVYFVRGAADNRIWFWIGVVNGTAGVLGGLLFNLQRDRLPVLNHNVFGFFPLTALFAICLSFPFVAGRLRWTVLMVLLAAANMGWIFLSGSRGDLLIGTVCLLFLVVTTGGLLARTSSLLAIAVAGTLLLSAFPDLRDRTLARVGKLLDRGYSVESRTSGRSDLLRGGLHIFAAHPFGVGTGGFAFMWSRLGYVEGVSGFKYGEEMAAHAGWLKVLVENGIVGILAFAAFVGSFAVTGWRHGDRVAGRLGVLVTAVLTVAFASTEFQPKGLWLLAAGATTLMHREALRVAWSGRAAALHWRLTAKRVEESAA